MPRGVIHFGHLGCGLLARNLAADGASMSDSTVGAAGRTDIPANDVVPDEQQWRRLDSAIRSWWDSDLEYATEDQISTSTCSLLFLPFPYVTPGGIEGVIRGMFAWDAYFINRGLLAHGRLDLVRNHILNYLSMVERYGYMPNMNSVTGMTRSQTPVFPDSIWRFYQASRDVDILYKAYPLLKHEYIHYWNAPHHQTDTGLATNRDLGDAGLSAELAAEAETGLDWTPIFNGDVRRCTPLITNCALVRYARVLALMAREIGCTVEAVKFDKAADSRAELIRRYCWSEEVGLFFEFDHVTGEQLSYVSDCAYWPLWAGVATRNQAYRLVCKLHLLEQQYGIASTAEAYADPHPETAYSGVAAVQKHENMMGGLGQLQWMYPAGWPPSHLISVEGLDEYGYSELAKRVAARFLSVVLNQYQNTGKLWEKYNVVNGSLVLPNSRYGNQIMHGWTAAVAVLLGRRIFLQQSTI